MKQRYITVALSAFSIIASPFSVAQSNTSAISNTDSIGTTLQTYRSLAPSTVTTNANNANSNQVVKPESSSTGNVSISSSVKANGSDIGQLFTKLPGYQGGSLAGWNLNASTPRDAGGLVTPATPMPAPIKPIPDVATVAPGKPASTTVLPIVAAPAIQNKITAYQDARSRYLQAVLAGGTDSIKAKLALLALNDAAKRLAHGTYINASTLDLSQPTGVMVSGESLIVLNISQLGALLAEYQNAVNNHGQDSAQAVHLQDQIQKLHKAIETKVQAAALRSSEIVRTEQRLIDAVSQFGAGSPQAEQVKATLATMIRAYLGL